MADTISVPITAEDITVTIEGTGGVTAHSGLTDLDFASAGHTGVLPMKGQQITGLGEATAPSGAATLNQIILLI